MSRVKTTEKEDKIIELFVNYFVEVVLNGELKFSDEVDDVEVTITEEFLTELREILNDKS